MDRALAANLIAKSGKAVEVAGDIDTLLLDKTGTITLGNRRATMFVPLGGTSERDLARMAAIASLADTTPEGKSIVELARNDFAMELVAPDGSRFIEFTAQTRMSGIDLPDGARIRKGAPDTMAKMALALGGKVPDGYQDTVDSIASKGATPLTVTSGDDVVGVIKLEDILKPGIRERFARLRQMGLRVVMVTGDNPLTAKSIAEEAGVDDFIAQATPEAKLAYIRKEQAGGKLVAMMGDGTNDAPALAQADIGVAMNSGTQAAKEAGNMVDLDSDPTKLIEVVEIGKQLLMTRGRPDDVLDRQRPGQVLRRHPGDVRRLPGARVAPRDRPDGPGDPRRAPVGDPVGGDLQRDHHPAADPDRAQGRDLPAGRGQRALAAQPAVLRPGRRDRAVHRDQADRHGHRPAARPRRHPYDLAPDLHDSRRRDPSHDPRADHRPEGLRRRPSSCARSFTRPSCGWPRSCSSRTRPTGA